MIKLNHKNQEVERLAYNLLFSLDTRATEQKENGDVVFEGKGYKIVTDRHFELLQVWQLDDCPSPIFEVEV